MTVYDVDPVVSYTLTGVSDFFFAYKVSGEEDLIVTWVDEDGTATQLVYLTDYTVALTVANTGTVTIIDTTMKGTLIISRDTPMTQEVNWVNNDPLDMIVQEASFDKLTMMVQDLDATSVSLPAGFPSGVEFPYPEAGLILGWNSAGDNLTNYPSYGSFEDLANEAIDAAADAATSEANAAASAAAAATSETNAAASADAAALSEANAAASEANVLLLEETTATLVEEAETAEANAGAWAQEAANCAAAALAATGEFDATDLEDLESSGIKTTLPQSATYTDAYRCLYMETDWTCYEASASASTTVPVIAMNIVADEETVITYGFVRNDTWTLVPGLVYLSETTGDITQTVPTTSGAVVQVIGVAVAANILFFNPQQTLIVLA